VGALQPSAQVNNSLYLRASIDPQGQVSLSPIYYLPVTPNPVPENSDFKVELLDENGDAILSSSIASLLAEEDGFTYRSINALIPLPDVNPTSIRLYKDGNLVSEKILAARDAKMLSQAAIVQTNQGPLLTWGLAGVPAIVRYTLDDQTWTTLAIDLLGGELLLDQDSLPAGDLRFEVSLGDNLSPALSTSWLNAK